MNALIVADPGFQTKSGHHAGFASLLASLRASGALPAKVDIYCHRAVEDGFVQELEQAGLGVRRHFATRFYAAYEPRENQAQLSPYIVQLAREYVALIEEQAGGPGTVLHHTLDWPHLSALGLALKSLGGKAANQCHLVFLLFSPGVDASGWINDPARALHYRVALSSFKGLDNVRLFASCEEYARGCTRLAGFEIGVHPCFLVHGPEEADDEAGSRRIALQKAKITLYLGDAKEAKGFGRIGELLDAIAPCVGAGASLDVYYNLDRYLATPAIERALGELQARARADSRIHLHGRYLGHDELIAVVRATDLFVLGYDPRAYRDKTSGLLWLLSCYRKPVLLVGNSWLTREAFRLNPWARCVATIAELKRALAGDAVFSRNTVDTQYRRALYEPFSDFLARACQ